MYLWGAESNQTWFIKWQNQSEKMQRKYHHHMLVNLWFSFLKSHFLLINLKLAHQFHRIKKLLKYLYIWGLLHLISRLLYHTLPLFNVTFIFDLSRLSDMGSKCSTECPSKVSCLSPMMEGRKSLPTGLATTYQRAYSSGKAPETMRNAPLLASYVVREETTQ